MGDSDDEFFEDQFDAGKENVPYPDGEAPFTDQPISKRSTQFQPVLTNISEEKIGDSTVHVVDFAERSFANKSQTVDDWNTSSNHFRHGQSAINFINDDWQKNKERSLFRLPDSFVASPNSYHFPSPPDATMTEDREEPPLCSVAISEAPSIHPYNDEEKYNDDNEFIPSFQENPVSESTPKKNNLSSFRDQYRRPECSTSKISDSLRLLELSQAEVPKKLPPPTSPKRTLLSRTIQKSFNDSPTFILDCTRKGGNPTSDKVRMLEADRSVMYFGFRPINSESEDAIAITNISDSNITLRYSITPKEASDVFKFPFPPASSRLAVGKKTYIRILFCPSDEKRYKAWLTVEIIRAGDKSLTFPVPLMGYGGQANVNPIQKDANKRASAISSSGRFQLFPRSIHSFQFYLKNSGERDAFVFVIIQGNNGEELPPEKVVVSPSSFLMGKNGSDDSERCVDVRIFDTSFGAGGSGLMGGSQRSLTTIFSRPPSAMDSSLSSVTQAVSPAFRVLVFWSEERQRKRLKSFERSNMSDQLTILNRCLSWKIEGEANNDSTRDTLLSLEDRRNCIASIRYNMIQIFERKRNMNSRSVSSRTGHGNTIIEVEPDDTLKAYESVCDNTLTK